MHLASAGFIIFIAILLAVYGVMPQRYRWLALLAGSLVFYAFAGASYLVYVCATVVSTYLVTLKMNGVYRARDKRLAEISDANAPANDKNADKTAKRAARDAAKKAATRWLVAGLVFNFAILAVVKYTDFVIGSVNMLTHGNLGFWGLVAPLGISFYTFKTMGYALDVYREKAATERNVLKLALFTTFFPQIIQGPISRYGELAPTLYAGTPLSAARLNRGAQRVLWGFFKKLVIADRLWPALTVLWTQTGEYAGLYALFCIVLYAVVLYADFTGGIDITIGVAEMFGVKVAENFDRPFYSKSITEYWRRWHITMGTWFRDYLFYPISVSLPMLRLSKLARKRLGEGLGKRVPVYIATLTVWFMTGLWHGPTWNFVAWGLANGVVILISQELQPLYARFHKRFTWAAASRAYGAFQIARTFMLMCFIRSFDCYAGVAHTFRMAASVFARPDVAGFFQKGLGGLGLSAADYISAGAGLLIVFWVSFLQRNGEDARDRLNALRWPARYAVVMGVLFAVVIFGAYGMGYDARQFIYNQF